MSALDIEMRITSFSDVKGVKRNTTWMSLSEFATASIATAKAPDKASLPLVKLAAFGDRRSSKGSLRHDKNVLEVSGVEIDYDGEQLPLDEAVKTLAAAEVPALLYSSPSHRPERPRWRILAPFSKPCPPERRSQMVGRIAGLFPVEMGAESWTLSQAYFYGSIEGQAPVSVVEVDGEGFVPVDLRAELDATAKAKPGKPNGANGQNGDWFDLGNHPADEAALRARIATGAEGTHDALVSLAGLLARRGVDSAALMAELTAALQQRSVPARNSDWHAHLADIPRLIDWVMQKEQERRAGATGADPWAQPCAKAVKSEEIEPEPEDWPEPMGLAAFHGLLGEAAAEIMPHTEADPHALLLQLLVFFGNKIGRGPHYRVGAAEHASNLYLLLAGSTSRARKGTSEAELRPLFATDAPDPWLMNCIQSGLSSGEGLIHAVRDEQWKKNREGDEELVDQGVADKRLLVTEGEFASVLAVMKREGNTLSPVLRNAWDRGTLQTLTKSSPLKATEALISVIGHITVDELRAGVDRIAVSNGLLNRFLFAAVKRSRMLPHGGNVNPGKLYSIGERLSEAARAAQLVGAVPMTPAAAEMWSAIYSELTRDHPGLYGSLIARAEAHAVRLALIYALADQKQVIELVHLEAALAVWRFSEASARVLFGDLLGDPVADAIVLALKDAGAAGLSRRDLSFQFSRNVEASRIQRALQMLARLGRARMSRRSHPSGQGRPAEIWHFVPRARQP
jgi:hypothetical protein